MVNKIIGVVAVILVVIIQGCNKDQGIFSKGDTKGNLTVSLTDSPFNIDLVEYAKVTITRVEIRKAGVSDTVPFIILSDKTTTVDLLKLRNGVVAELVSLDIPVGTYDQLRLITSGAELKIKGGETFNVKIPSGSQTGIKIFINPSIQVEGGLISDLLLDFDLSNSFVMKGNVNKPNGINGFNFKPVIRAVNNSATGRIEGLVTDITLAKIVNASVWVKKDTIISTAFTDTLGKYVFLGIPAGTYTMGAARQKYDTLIFTGVKVIAGNKTIRNFGLKPQVK